MVHSDFVHLHVHTQYSLLDGACLLTRLVEKAKEFKLPALAITDHGNLFGAIEFYNLCLQAGIKPIIGAECYLAPNSRWNKDSKNNGENQYHLVLLAKDLSGYKNLIKLVSRGYLEGFYYKPRIDKELLSQYSEGLICLSSCLKGEIASLILGGKISSAYKVCDDYLQIFGKDNFYLEIMENGLSEQKIVNENLIKISKELKIPLVATNDVHYINREEAFAHEVLLCIQTQTTLADPNRMKFNSDQFYLRRPEEMKALFKDLSSAIKNTLEITEKCNLVLDFSQTHLPKFPLPPGVDENTFLERLCKEALPKKYKMPDSKIEERLRWELDIIKKTGFSSYFLIIWDLIKYAKEKGIPVGPGRGSAAGSVVSYLLGITEIDPLKYNLIFERFLNPQRVTMPDIDIDFCYEKRPLVLEYVAQRYGKDNVAQIITFGTMLSRAVVRDVGRVMGFSYSEVDRIAKLIPQESGMTLKRALEVNSELKSIYQRDARIRRLIDTAFHLEGLSRHASVHAAGVVISDKPLTEYLPLFKTSDNQVVTGFDMKSLEKIGLLKMDFLGLKTLTVIEETLKIIKRTQGKVIDITSIPLNDQKTFRLLSKGETLGIFQVESSGMRELLKRLKPEKFEDLIAVLALYRPGPIGSGMVEDFIQRKHKHKPIDYFHPKLEPILKDTYGIIIFQEQVMQVASELAGFSFSEADLLRRAMGKKIPEVMEEQRKNFVEGCKRKGVSEGLAHKIFDLMEYFSHYGFNKSHSTAYALISYRTAYLKANFPVEFMTALLTSEKDNTDKLVEYVNEAKKMGIEILPPDINESFADFTVVGERNIRFGLLAIKNLGASSAETIIKNRKEYGKFKDLFDFTSRLDSKSANKKVVESLIKCGAMDSFGKRAYLMHILPQTLEYSSKLAKEKSSGQLSLFDSSFLRKAPSVDNQTIQEWPKQQLLQFEKELLGFYITGHPLSKFQNLMKKAGIIKISQIADNPQGEIVTAGLIDKVNLTTTRKSKELMAIVRIEDEESFLEVFVFPKVFEEVKGYLKKGNIVALRGRATMKEGALRLLATRIAPLEGVYDWISRVDLYIQEPSSELAEKLKVLLNSFSGNVPVILHFRHPEIRFVKVKAGQDFYIKPQPELFEEFSSLLGEENYSLTLI
ncbi:MAG TPA: DNA polymerase III subunit alpha [Candidatus Omnitrophica bacterium]|nr:MAG: DNA polymerase III subunit alpha [Candidatus Omnitrophota bacterium]RKY34511.1 MAG: DNA polymerase III subunit alpha [Candidatus Omnitrophota bacterium]RKY44860.1 MAG: DNA polymerase III subunit alpha [Candidatus Omnitrophota bacterium]HEC69689.1 DNA polymerase III subunit alpha [Candidatus Omnitrophota bacterium]